MEALSTQKRAAILRCLIEGNSILATARITGAAKNTIVKLLAQAGEACSVYQSKTLRNLPCKVLQLDEIWSFVGCKEKAKADAVDRHPGDVWTWTSICAETKLIPAWRVGDRSSFAQLVKIYGKDAEGRDVVVRTERQPVFGTPNIDLVSTSYVERSNLTIRMGNRRFTRSTNAFSKKLENHCHMLAVTFMHYNFCRKHTTIKTAPAVAAGIADHVWTLEEVVEMIDAHFAAKVDAQFEAAFAVKLTPARTKPKTYAPVAPQLPWYLKGFKDGDAQPPNFHN